MDDEYFKQLFERIVEVYQIAPDTAEELLQRILEILSQNTEDSDLSDEHDSS